MGEWLGPKPVEHVHDLPSIGWHNPAGSRWRCACGAIYEVVEMRQHGESWLQWRCEVRPVVGES